MKALESLKKQALEHLKNQLSEIIFSPDVHSFNRFGKFLEVQDKIHGWQYWFLLKLAYQCSDGLYDHRAEIKEAFIKDEPERRTLMSNYERRYLDSLGPRVRIYRGMSKSEAESENYGYSWTLSRKIAERFAYKYHRAPFPPEQMTVISQVVDKSDIIAYFSGPEREIIYIHKKNRPNI